MNPPRQRLVGNLARKNRTGCGRHGDASRRITAMPITGVVPGVESIVVRRALVLAHARGVDLAASVPGPRMKAPELVLKRFQKKRAEP